jgi:hypothetical protein
MSAAAPIESFGELAQRFPGIEEQDPVAMGVFAFHVATHDRPEVFNTYSSLDDPAWRRPAEEVLEEVRQWQEQPRDAADRLPTLSMALRIVRRGLQHAELQTLIPQLQELDIDEGMTLVGAFLERNHYGTHTSLARSPLFPDGRTQFRALTDQRDSKTGAIRLPYGSSIIDKDGNALDEHIEDFLRTQYPRAKSGQAVKAIVEGMDALNHEELEQLRSQYGSKAANLLYFQTRITQLNDALQQNDHAEAIEIPPFKAVSVDAYSAWLSGSAEFEVMCEAARVESIGLLQDEDGVRVADLVAVRSSALKSEDDGQHSGAGIYDSIAVNPNDQAAFRAAMEKVYHSARSDGALAYQESIGVTDELMGLVIQQYQEQHASESRVTQYFGHANSTGPNPNLLDLHTQEGILLYDKVWLLANLLLSEERPSDPLRGRINSLHSIPDHESPLGDAVGRGSLQVAYAAILAERFFGRPMQVEFAGSAIVQVRPLFLEAYAPEVVFPEDQEPLIECAGSGVGDQVLEQLEAGEDNSDKSGYVVFDSEYGFTNNTHSNTRSLPKEGAAIILSAASTGHIQALCREKGLLCFYPKSGDLDDVADEVLFAFGEGERTITNTTLRVISDGYEGRIYQAEQEAEAAQA